MRNNKKKIRLVTFTWHSELKEEEINKTELVFICVSPAGNHYKWWWQLSLVSLSKQRHGSGNLPLPCGLCQESTRDHEEASSFLLYLQVTSSVNTEHLSPIKVILILHYLTVEMMLELNCIVYKLLNIIFASCYNISIIITLRWMENLNMWWLFVVEEGFWFEGPLDCFFHVCSIHLTNVASLFPSLMLWGRNGLRLPQPCWRKTCIRHLEESEELLRALLISGVTELQIGFWFINSNCSLDL